MIRRGTDFVVLLVLFFFLVLKHGLPLIYEILRGLLKGHLDALIDLFSVLLNHNL
jgi:hypothetical protein